jgi:hypothetical protein
MVSDDIPAYVQGGESHVQHIIKQIRIVFQIPVKSLLPRQHCVYIRRLLPNAHV